MPVFPALLPLVLKSIAIALLALGAVSFAILIQGSFVLRRLARDNPRDDAAAILKSSLTPQTGVLFTTATGGLGARAFTRRLLGLHFGHHEVVVALNGVAETELDVWRTDFRLAPSQRQIAGVLPTGTVRGVFESRDLFRLVIVDLERSEAQLAWNAAANASQGAIVAFFGEGCDFEPDALLRLIPPMLEDPKTVAVCGVAPGVPGGSLFQQFAALDYLRSWLSRAAAFSGWNLLTPPPASAILISRDALIRAGGFRTSLTELFLRLHIAGRSSPPGYRVSFAPKAGLRITGRSSRPQYRIAFVPNAGCRQRAPKSPGEFRRTVAFTQREAARCALTRSAFPVWLRGGLVAIHFVWPALELLSYALLIAGIVNHWVDWQLATLVLLSTVGLGALLSMSAVALRELAEYHGSDPGRLARLFFSAIPENLGFRQMRCLWLIAPLGVAEANQLD